MTMIFKILSSIFSQVLAKDSDRVNQRFSEANERGIRIQNRRVRNQDAKRVMKIKIMIRIRIRVRARIRIMIMMIPGNQGFEFRIEVRMMLKITQIIKTGDKQLDSFLLN